MASRALLLTVSAVALLGAAPAGAAAQAPNRVTVFPSPGNKFAHPGTQVSFRGVAAGRLGAVTIVGSRSGVRRISLRNHSDGKGVSALVDRPFTPGESVSSPPPSTSVTVAAATSGSGFPGRAPDPPSEGAREARPASAVQFFHSRRDLRPTRVSVTRRRGGVTGGHVFVAPKIGPGRTAR